MFHVELLTSPKAIVIPLQISDVKTLMASPES
jgi:hypothetical protein